MDLGLDLGRERVASERVAKPPRGSADGVSGWPALATSSQAIRSVMKESAGRMR